ncbi:insecticidal delta-endotoxin Cry8Ea1 family protein [Bacillus thuringiensis]|nr:insecticidal delta-endotoxin Cry8Ea1 family protein [Bacillus thuringiensis]MED2783191.1 insecticidal delta-endotoxin Cry8Ea1 family protein [Bacillus thuringiensis]
MKYKDRKHAKRKYKPALLATVATMTLGVSTLGSTSSAFAAEEDNISIISSHTLNNVGTQVTEESINEIIPNLTLREKFKNNVIDVLNNKSTAKVGVNAAFAFLKDAQKDIPSFNNSFRSLAMASTELIPYAGMVISPLIGLLWSEEGGTTAQLNALRDQLLTIMDQKLDNEYVKNLTTDFDTLDKDILRLEKSLNADGISEPNGLFSGNDIYATRGNWANHIQHSFEALINRASSNHSVASLPLYTKIATAHIMFLKYMDKNGTGPKLKYDQKSLRDFFDQGNLDAVTKKYADHIEKTYKEGLKTFNDDIKALEDKKKEKTEMLKYPLTGGGLISGGNPVQEAKLHTLNAEIAKLETKNLEQNKRNFIDSTLGDQAAQEILSISNQTIQEVKAELSKQGPVAAGEYKIVSKIDSNKVLDFNQGSLGNSILYDYKGGANQQWTMQYNKDKNAYQIISKKDSNKALSWDQSGGKAYEAKYVFLAGKANDLEQYWTLEDAGDGYFFIHSLKDSNMVLDIQGNNAINETPIKVYPKTGGDNEKFKFEGLN